MKSYYKKPSKQTKIVYVYLIVIGVFLILSGFLFTTKVEYTSAESSLQSWRSKSVNRTCDDETANVVSGQLITKDTNNIVSFLNSDCKGYDVVNYYAYDMIFAGIILLTISSALYLYPSIKK